MTIQTVQDYETALSEIERLFDAPPESPEEARLEELCAQVRQYEETHYPIQQPSLLGRILFHIDRLGFWRWLLSGCPLHS